MSNAGVSGTGKKIRVGVLLNDFRVPAWEYKILEQICNSEYAEIVMVIKNSYPVRKKSFTGKIARAIISFIEYADKKVFRLRPDFSTGKEITGLLEKNRGIAVINIDDPEDRSAVSRAAGEVKRLEPDIIYKSGDHKQIDVILEIPVYGILTYSPGICGRKDSVLTGFREVIGGIPVTNAKLGILSHGKPYPQVIFSSWESTCHYSVSINRNIVFWRAALHVPRVLRGLYNYGDTYLDSLKKRFASEDSWREDQSDHPGIGYAAGSLFRYPWIVFRAVIRKLLFTDAFSWHLLYGINDSKKLSSLSFDRFREIASPEGAFWADPFPVAYDEGYYIFAEEFVYRKNIAHLSVLTLDKTGRLLGSRKIIEKPYHLSYPFIFMTDNTYYMIPETCQNRTIELYRCRVFPYEWEFDRNIMENISAVDTTLFYHKDKWWLFTSADQTSNVSGCSAELHLFWSEDLFSGRWESHPLNPVVSDIRLARPAGKIFISDGMIIRPSQDCEGRYGVGFNYNQVTKLSEEEYEEVRLSEIKPDWNKRLKGTHTLNSDGDFTVIDVYKFRKRISF